MTVIMNALPHVDPVDHVKDPDRLYCPTCHSRGTVIDQIDHGTRRRVACKACEHERFPSAPDFGRAEPDDLIGAYDAIHEVRLLDDGVPPVAYRDDARIGQEKVAKIRAEIGMDLMTEHHWAAFKIGYVNAQVRAMSRRLFYKGRAQYERAQAVTRMVAEGRKDFSERGSH